VAVCLLHIVNFVVLFLVVFRPLEKRLHLAVQLFHLVIHRLFILLVLLGLYQHVRATREVAGFEFVPNRAWKGIPEDQENPRHAHHHLSTLHVSQHLILVIDFIEGFPDLRDQQAAK